MGELSKGRAVRRKRGSAAQEWRGAETWAVQRGRPKFNDCVSFSWHLSHGAATEGRSWEGRSVEVVRERAGARRAVRGEGWQLGESGLGTLGRHFQLHETSLQKTRDTTRKNRKPTQDTRKPRKTPARATQEHENYTACIWHY